MKIALVTDTHFGARNDSPVFLDHFLNFFENQFFPYLEKNNIVNVLHLGDLLDRRKYVNFNTLSLVQKRFIDLIEKNNINFHHVIGNHDTYFKNTNDVNSVNELFRNKIKIYSSPEEIEFDGIRIAVIPWINKNNIQDSIEFINKTSCEYAVGHLELKGFQVLRGVPSEEGLDPKLFKKFKSVFSGHFHCRHSNDNIHYLGSPYQITFSDLDEIKGFYIFDTETEELGFVRNTSKLYHKIRYDDKKYDMTEVDCEFYSNSFVKIIVENKSNPILFDSFVDQLYSCGVNEISILEDYTETNNTQSLVDISKDTLTLINEEIDNMKDVENKNKLKNMIHDLYIESLTVVE